ncbi:ABC transporter substrate-binding protein [Helicobacter sp.]|uniref:ABC transporter substrate-binding protein n=1 Tax=Helicobacter sp. TaxID=218 RepID=UPI0025C01A7D|nr:ABC transporter substrate-binding protein [Helicobacter sp.]MCI5968295.1 ABC transporter substrate-binding protein [Helicobacter sp.]
MKKIAFVLALCCLFYAQGFAKTKVAVIGGMWPVPNMLSVYTDAEIIYMPRSGLIEDSVVLDFFPKLREIKKGANSDNDNIEELLLLKADLYICHQANVKICGALKKAGVELIELGVNVDNYNFKKALESWIFQLEKYFPIKEKNQKLIAEIERIQKDIAQRIEGKTKPRVLIVRQYSEKNISPGFYADYFYKQSGAANSYDFKANGSINLEEVYKLNPEVIFISNFTPLMPQDLYDDKKWQGLQAVKDKRVYKVPLGSYRAFAPNLDFGPFLLYLAQKNYPDAFRDMDIKEVYKEHFKTFFNLELSEEQLERVFNPTPIQGTIKQ